MFYCQKCGERNRWPVNDPYIMRSAGPCECCGKSALCYDVPSSALPIPSPRRAKPKAKAKAKAKAKPKPKPVHHLHELVRELAWFDKVTGGVTNPVKKAKKRPKEA